MTPTTCKIFLIIGVTVVYSSANQPKWTGKWFPHSPGEPDVNAVLHQTVPKEIYDPHHGVQMGVSNDKCDNAKVNLTVDWDDSPINYTCFGLKYNYLPDPLVRPTLRCDHIPVGYSAPHACMNQPIYYDEVVPSYGTHRPLWPRYGEYKFVPKQRWIHNLEHGAVVMLYHPCANAVEVQKLKSIVKNCLYRHIITPYNLLSSDRPLALVTWGCRLLISKVDEELVKEFITTHALNGPEHTSRDGQYDHELIHPAGVITDQDDSKLCAV